MFTKVFNSGEHRNIEPIGRFL